MVEKSIARKTKERHRDLHPNSTSQSHNATHTKSSAQRTRRGENRKKKEENNNFTFCGCCARASFAKERKKEIKSPAGGWEEREREKGKDAG